MCGKPIDSIGNCYKDARHKGECGMDEANFQKY